MKRCSRCGSTQPRENFYKRPDAKDGLRSHCKSCSHATSAEYRRERWRPSRLTINPYIGEEDGSLELPPYTEWEAEWKQKAACRGLEKLFLNLDTIGPSAGKACSKVRAICEACPVFAECRTLVDMIELPPDYKPGNLPTRPESRLAGYWAGELPTERVIRRCKEAAYPIPAWLDRPIAERLREQNAPDSHPEGPKGLAE